MKPALVRCIICAFSLTAVPALAEAQKAIVLVRHAEKVDDSKDAELSDQGRVRSAALARALRDAGITVIYATDAHTPQDDELRKWPPHAMAGTQQAAIVDGVRPHAGDVVWPKRTYSPFLSSGFDAELTARGIRLLYIAGLHTDCCARHTSGDAFQKGYDLVWVTDALQAFTEEAHRQGLEYFKAWYATDPARQFQTADDVVRELRGVRQEAMASR